MRLTEEERAEIERLFGWVPEPEPLAYMLAAVERILTDRLAAHEAREARVIEALLQQVRMDREVPYWQGEPHGETLDHVEAWLSSLADWGWSLRLVLAGLDGPSA